MSAQDIDTIDLEESARLDRELPLDVALKKQVEDLERYERIFAETRPTVIIETGTWRGYSAGWFAARVPQVITIDQVARDIDIYPRVTYYTNGSLDPETLESVRAALTLQDRVLVSLDSAHDTAHVLAELGAYAPFVTLGSYLVVEDTIHHWREPGAFPTGGDPWEALEIWQPSTHGFEVAYDIESMSSITANPGGWLRRVR